jgi:hypothetical protein
MALKDFDITLFFLGFFAISLVSMRINSVNKRFYMAKNRLYKFRRVSLVIAEFMNYWSIIPCLMLIAYGFLLIHTYIWYTSIPTYPEYKCDAAVLQIFIESKMDLQQAKATACQVAETVGGPTTTQATFATALFGLASVIFGLYTANRPNMNAVNYNQLPPVPEPRIMTNDAKDNGNGETDPEKPDDSS